MNAVPQPQSLELADTIRRADLPAIGAPFGGGYFTRLHRCGDTVRAVITADKSQERSGKIWLPNRKMLTAALSFTNGYANTVAMAEAGNKFAEEILAMGNGWHIGALDQVELQYRTFKPGTQNNFCMSGCNANALPPTDRYMPDLPGQTALEEFRAGGPQAFDTSGFYGTSTQCAGYDDCFWATGFDYGDQNLLHKGNDCRVRPVRSPLVID